MDTCVGREEELRYLNDLWEKVPVSCAVCGRRHLGKTTILREFTADKPYIYLTGTQGLRSDNLEGINRALSRFSGERVRIADVIDLFPQIRRVCGRQRVVVIIDRLTDLSENFEEFNSYIRAFMNRELCNTRIMLVVCDNDNSLFGRFYYTLELKPMSYIDCKGFHPGYTPLQHLKAYAIVGGTPGYHSLFVDEDPDEVIRTRMFDHMSVFSLEAEGMVASETMVRGSCAKVLAALASGAESIREISSRTGMSSSFCTKVVEDMEHKAILQKEVSSGMSRRTVYTISSNIIRFYYQVVNRYTHMVEFESPDIAYQEARRDIDRYMEMEFKSICMDYVTRAYDYRFVGKLRKWDDSVDAVIDFLASVTVSNSERMIVARCRLYGSPMGERELEELMSRANRVEGSSKVYMMFSGCGFTQDLVKTARGMGSRCRLLTLDEIYEG